MGLSVALDCILAMSLTAVSKGRKPAALIFQLAKTHQNRPDRLTPKLDQDDLGRNDSRPKRPGFTVRMGSKDGGPVLFDLILYDPSTIFQLNRYGYSWVEPVLSWDKCVLYKDHNAVMPVGLEHATLRSRVKHSTTEPLHSLPRSCETKLVHFEHNAISNEGLDGI